MIVMTTVKENRGSTKRPRGPADPARRERIAEAAITVALEHGLDAVTHRKVAAEADVPLGSTTYYFQTIDDLLSVAMEKAAQRSVEHLRAWESSIHADADLSAALADYVIDSLGQSRTSTVFEYNLYALACSRPTLRKAAWDWDQGLVEVMCKRTDAITGRLLAVTLCGLLLQCVLSEDDVQRDEVELLFRRALAGSLDADA